MTLKGNLNKISITLGIIITVVTLIAGGVRLIDLTHQTAETVDKLSLRIENEQTEMEVVWSEEQQKYIPKEIL